MHAPASIQPEKSAPETVDPKTVKNAEAITTVRALLFGDDMSEVDNRLQDVHQELLKEISTLQTKVASLEEKLSKKIDDGLLNEQTERKEAIEKIKQGSKDSIKSLQKSFDSSLQHITEETSAKEAALAEIFSSAATALKK